MLDGGEDVRRVQEWFGHANLATTQMYQQRARQAGHPQLAQERGSRRAAITPWQPRRSGRQFRTAPA